MAQFDNTEIFIKKAQKKYGNLYDYSLVNYKRSNVDVLIKCSIHGVFKKRPDNHLSGQGCPICKNKQRIINQTFTSDIFIEKAKLIHGNKYDYSLVNYQTARIHVNIICPIHGVFKQMPHKHLKGQGCHFCADKENGIRFSFSSEIFIEKARVIHGTKYDYYDVHYINMWDKVKISCPHHGIFIQSPVSHLSGCGCPKCQNSSGERIISRILEQNNVYFIQQKKFSSCKIEKCMRFDFLIPSLKTIIEYHGKQHFIPVDWMGGLKQLMNIKRNDEYKKRWAIENGYIFKEYNYKQSWDFIEKDIKKLLK